MVAKIFYVGNKQVLVRKDSTDEGEFLIVFTMEIENFVTDYSLRYSITQSRDEKFKNINQEDVNQIYNDLVDLLNWNQNDNTKM
jgi:DNA-binding protein Fis